MGLSLKKLVSKAWDQINPLDNGRTWQNPKGAPVKPGQKAPSAIQQLKSEVKHAPAQAKKAGTAVGLGAVRSATGVAQGVTGVADLVGKSKGTSQASKLLNSFAQFTDRTAQAEHVDPFLYHASQTGTDLLTLAATGGVSGYLKAPEVVTKGVQASRFLQPALDVMPKITSVADRLMPAEDAVGKVAHVAVKNLVSPKNQAMNLAYTAKATGENASKGGKTSAKDVAINYGTGVAADVGLPVVGAIAKPVIKSAAAGTKSLVRDAVNEVKTANKAPKETPQVDLPVANVARKIAKKYATVMDSRKPDVTPVGKVKDTTTKVPTKNAMVPKENGTPVELPIASAAKKLSKKFVDYHDSRGGVVAADKPKAPGALPVANATKGVIGKVKSGAQKYTDALDKAAGKEVPVREQKPLKVTADQGKRTKVAVDAPKNSLVSKARQKIVETDQPIFDALNASDKKTGRKDAEIFMANSNIQRKANARGQHNFTESEHVQQALHGLSGKQLKEAHSYIVARRELSYPKGMKTSAPRRELRAIKNKYHDQYGARFDHIREFHREEARKNQAAGLISKQKMNEYNKSDDYMRLQRDVEDKIHKSHPGGNSYSLSTSSQKQHLKGSNRKVDDVFKTTLAKAQQNENERLRNKTASHLIDSLMSSGQARRVKSPAGKNVIARHVQGKVQYFEVSPEIKKVVDRVNPFELNTVTKILAVPGRLFRATVTGLDPVFTLTNYIRDQWDSFNLSSSARNTHRPDRVAEGLAYSFQHLIGSKVHDEVWDKFIKNFASSTSFEATRSKASASRVIRSIQGGAKNRTINALINPLRTMEDINGTTEIATRFQNYKGIYDKTLQETGSKEVAEFKANLAAAQHSVDFGRTGEWSRFMNVIVPYWNPAVQGSRSTVRALKNRPVSTSAKIVTTLATPVIAATLWNMSDPHRRAVYNNLADYEKDNNLIIIPPHSDVKKSQRDDKSYGVIKVPLPPGIAGFGNMARRMLEAHESKHPTDFKSMAEDAFSVGAGPVDIHNKDRFVGSVIGQTAKTGWDQASNKDHFTGKAIVPDYLNNATDNNGNPIKEKDKKYKFSSGTAEAISSKTNISPIRIEKLVKETTGTVGQYVLNASDNALARAGLIGKDNIGGISPKGKVTKKFASAQGVNDMNQTAAQKHFGDVDKAIKQVGLNKNELGAYNSAVHPQKKDVLGNPMNDKTPVDALSRADAYIQYPKLWEVDKKADAMARKRGEPGNPMFDLNPDQKRTLLAIQRSNPDDTDVGRLKMDNPWLVDYYKKTSAFYDKVTANKKSAAAANIPIWQSPVASDAVSRKLDAMSQISDGKAKSAYIQNNADVQDYLAKADQATRAKRAWMGLPQFDAYPTPTGKLKAALDKFDSLPQHDGKRGGNKSRYDYIQAHPEIASFFNKVSEYSAMNNAKLNMYEGPDKPGSSSGGGGGGGSSSGSFSKSSGSSSGSSSSGNANFSFTPVDGWIKRTSKAGHTYYTPPRASSSRRRSSGRSFSSGGGGSSGSGATGMENAYAHDVTLPGANKMKANSVSFTKHTIKGKTKAKAGTKPTLTRKKSKA